MQFYERMKNFVGLINDEHKYELMEINIRFLSVLLFMMGHLLIRDNKQEAHNVDAPNY